MTTGMDQTYRLGRDDAPAAVILAHGRGGSAADMAGLARAVGGDVRWLLPEAPGGSWWPQSFLAPRAANEPHLSRAVAAVERLVAELSAEGVPAERVVLAGFSQGACLAVEAMRQNPRRYGGAAILTGGLHGPPGTTFAPVDLAGVPVFIAGAEGDAWVPAARVRETADFLEASGAAVERVMDAGAAHTVRLYEVERFRALVARVAAG
jgi:phospholipase/carboxylesterase